MSKAKVSVLFQPCGRRGEVDAGKTVLEAAQGLGVLIESLCGGKSTCGKCKVRVEAKASVLPGKSLPPFTDEEAKYIKEDERQKGYRLACACKLYEDALIYIPEESKLSRQIIRKDPGEIKTDLDPGVKAYYLELDPPTLNNPFSDLERLLLGLTRTFGLPRLDIDITALRTLPHQLRAGGWKVTALVWMDREIVDVRSGRIEDFYGAAVDIGTTTVALYICNLRNGQVASTGAMMNPQVAYGEDVMSRITYSMMNPGEGLKRLQGLMIEGLNGLIRSTGDSAGIRAENILEMTVVGNTAMHHIFLGIDPQTLGLSPFPPAVHDSVDLKARDLGLEIHPAANIHVLPVEAGFVGADNVGVLISQEPYRRKEINLIIDVGTNGELLLGNSARLLSSSCATGPAFEGAQIQFGMRAAPGAIEKVRIAQGSLKVKYKVIGKDGWNDEIPSDQVQARGICGSGIIDAVAEMFRAGILEKSGRMNGNLDHPRLRRGGKGPEFVLAWAKETAGGRDITISLADVRAVQLAKGALYCGAKIMMKNLGLERIDRVTLAGGFGSYIDPERAMILGMFPDCGLEKVTSVGNAAGDGARLALLDRKKRKEADQVAREVEYIELTVYPEFSMEFAEAMYFPHMKDPFPHLTGILNPKSEIIE